MVCSSCISSNSGSSAKTYALTIPAAHLYSRVDSVLPASIIKVSTGLLFKSNVASVIVIINLKEGRLKQIIKYIGFFFMVMIY
jgi:hypothetical protein